MKDLGLYIFEIVLNPYLYPISCRFDPVVLVHGGTEDIPEWGEKFGVGVLGTNWFWGRYVGVVFQFFGAVVMSG